VPDTSAGRVVPLNEKVLRLASYLSLLLDTQLAAVHHRSDALARLEKLDSVILTGPTYADATGPPREDCSGDLAVRTRPSE
jgi:hypothetical protein